MATKRSKTVVKGPKKNRKDKPILKDVETFKEIVEDVKKDKDFAIEVHKAMEYDNNEEDEEYTGLIRRNGEPVQNQRFNDIDTQVVEKILKEKGIESGALCMNEEEVKEMMDKAKIMNQNEKWVLNQDYEESKIKTYDDRSYRKIKRNGEVVENQRCKDCASVNKNTGGTVPLAGFKGIPDDMKRLQRELKRQKSFTEKALEHFKNSIQEKNKLIENLQEELLVVHKRNEMFDSKLKTIEELMNKLFLEHLKNEELTEEDKFDQFIDELKIIFN